MTYDTIVLHEGALSPSRCARSVRAVEPGIMLRAFRAGTETVRSESSDPFTQCNRSLLRFCRDLNEFQVTR